MTYFSASNPKPMRAMKLDKPDTSNMFLHATESSTSYAWATQKLNFLLEFMKFLPHFEQAMYEGDINEYQDMLDEYAPLNTDGTSRFGRHHKVASENNLSIWGAGMGAGYDDIDFHPDAAEFMHIEGKGATGASNPSSAYYIPQWVFDRIGGLNQNKSYYDIVMSDWSLGGFNDEKAFTLMASMYESRCRAYAAMTELFGKFNMTDNHAAMISTIDAWYNDPNRGGNADPHNIKILISFLKIQHSVTNIMKAYYSGDIGYMEPGGTGNLDNDRFIAFNTAMRTKAGNYVTTAYNDYQSKLANYNWAANPKNGQSQATIDYWWTQQNNAYNVYTSLNNVLTGWKNGYDSPTEYPQYAGRGAYYGWDRVGTGDQVINGVGHRNYTRSQIDGLTISMLHGYQTTPQFYSNWVIHALGRESQCSDREISKVVTINVINRSSRNEYKQKMKEYYDKKDEDIQAEAEDARAAAQQTAEKKKAENAANQARQTREVENKRAQAKSEQNRKESQAADQRNANNRAQNNKPKAKPKEEENA